MTNNIWHHIILPVQENECFITSVFTHSFNKYLVSIYCIPGIEPDTRHRLRRKIDTSMPFYNQ